MKKFLKFLLVVFIWVLIGVAVIGGSLLAGLPLETGAVIFACVFGAWLLFLLIRKIVITYQAKKKVESLVNVEETEKKSWQFNFSMSPSPLQKNFVDMLKVLRKSYLKVHGDPTYVLPWYLMIGESGSGKTSVLRNANLPSPTIDFEAVEPAPEGFSWNLYNQGIILDTPGDFIAGDNQQHRNSQWLELMGLLKKHRPKEPINGLIVTVSLDDLLQENSQKLIDKGIAARKNIEQLMQHLHVQVPIYILVTKLDKLAGIQLWSESLSESIVKDPIGEVNSAELEPASFINGAVGHISERLKQLMLSAINQDDVSAELLVMPTKFETLERQLITFSESLFQANPYQKTPFFRALYFVGESQKSDLNNKSLFSQRVFTDILPKERSMVTSLARAEKVARNQRLGKAFAYNAVFAVVTATLYATYKTDKSMLTDLVNNNAGSFEETLELSSNIGSLYQYRDMVQSLQQHSWTPWYSVGGSPEFVAKLEGVFSERVQARLVEKTDQVFVKELANSFTRDADISEEKIVAFISTLVRRINILDAFLAGENESYLASMPPPYSDTDAEFFGIDDTTVIQLLNLLYLQSLDWNSDRSALEQEVKLLDEQLQSILVKSKDLSKWLIPWADRVAKSSEVQVSDYWLNGTGQLKNDTMVTGAYTKDGKDVIEDFLEQIKNTGRYDDILANILPGFEGSYKKSYLAQWEKFAENFPKGSEKLRGRNEWLNVVNNLGTGRNVYFNALNLVEEQISPYKDDADLPGWASMMSYYQEMRSFAPDEKSDNSKKNKMLAKMALKLAGKAGPLGKAIAGAGKKGMKTQKKMAKANKGSGPSPDERQMQLEEAGKLLGEYRKALSDFVYSAEMRTVSHAAISGLYANPDNPANGESSLAMSYASLKKLQAIVGKENAGNKAFWSLYTGAISLMQDYMVSESSCQMQDIWSSEFLTSLEGVPEYKLGNLAFGNEGMLWPFLQEKMGPFVKERFGAGYVANKVQGNIYPLNNNFLEFAARAKDGKQAKQDSYPVQLYALPTSANLDTKYHVSETSLTMQCAEGEVSLINKNFPNSKVFDWNDACSSVNLTIKIGRFTLEKRYEGPLGFPHFLEDFKTGQRRFASTDFPNFTQRLRESGISFMDVKYRITGQSALLKSLNSKQLDIPRNIASCWVDNQNMMVSASK